jgi:hypothetical protein
MTDANALDRTHFRQLKAEKVQLIPLKRIFEVFRSPQLKSGRVSTFSMHVQEDLFLESGRYVIVGTIG